MNHSKLLIALSALIFVNGCSSEVEEPPSTLATILNAEIIDLSHTWDENAPIAGVNPDYSMNLAATHELTRGQFGDDGQLSFTSEQQGWSGQHGAPSIDALGHIGKDGMLFGGIDASAATSDARGLGRSGTGENLDIAHFPVESLVSRGVLIDVARYINGNDTPLSDDFAITAEHLQATVDAYHLDIQPGDTILIRTGWGQYFSTDADRYKGEASAGLTLSGAQWLVEHQAAIVGSDTLTFERRPPIAQPPEVDRFQVFPVHMYLIAQNGVYIIENYNLEALSATGQHEFAIANPPLKIRGGTASALRSFALLPR